MPTPDKKPVVNPKTAALVALVGAMFVAAVAFYPPLKPVCVALSFCTDEVVEIPAAQ